MRPLVDFRLRRLRKIRCSFKTAAVATASSIEPWCGLCSQIVELPASTLSSSRTTWILVVRTSNNARLSLPRSPHHRSIDGNPPWRTQFSSCLTSNSLRWWSQNHMSGFFAFHRCQASGTITTAEYPQIAHRTITPIVPAFCILYSRVPVLANVATTNSWCMRKSLSAWCPLVE